MLMAVKVKEIVQRVERLEIKVQDLERQVKPEGKVEIGMTVEEASELFKNPPNRTPEAIKKALSIVGIARGGPDDLSEHCRYYLYGFPKQKRRRKGAM